MMTALLPTMDSLFIYCVSALLLALAVAEEVHNITVSPEFQKAELNSDIEIACTTSLAGTTTYWRDINGSIVLELNSTQISDRNGTLTITHITEEYGGIYTCTTSDDVHSAEAKVDVYEMPNYFKAGMVIFAICAGLVLIFFICLIHQYVKQRRHNDKGYNRPPIPS